MELVIRNIDKIYSSGSKPPLKGISQGKLRIRRGESILVDDGKIVSVGKDVSAGKGAERIDASGMIAIPGFVDSHTHMVYGGDRAEEFELRAKGVTYLELLQSGNGILKTWRDTRDMGSLDLFIETSRRLEMHLRNGITSMEMKSGYGFSRDSEQRMLQVIERLESAYKIRISRTLLPLHAMPPDKNREEYIQESMDMLSEFKGEYDFTDVFCDKGAFTVKESEAYFSKASELGIPLRLHADEIEDIGATEICSKFPFRSVDHLLHTSERGMELVRRAGAVATFLPATSFSLGEKYAEGRKWISKGVPVVLASDHSPLNPISSMQFVGNLAMRFCKLTAEESLNAMTCNAAYSLDLHKNIGSIEEGMEADMVFYKTSDLRDIFYKWDMLKPSLVIRGGDVQDFS